MIGDFFNIFYFLGITQGKGPVEVSQRFEFRFVDGIKLRQGQFA